MTRYRFIPILIPIFLSLSCVKTEEKSNQVTNLKEQPFYEIIWHHNRKGFGFIIRDESGNEKRILKDKQVVPLDNFNGRIFYRYRTPSGWAYAVYNIKTDEDKEVEQCPWQEVYKYDDKLFELRTPETESHADALIFKIKSQGVYQILNNCIYFPPKIVQIRQDKETEYKPIIAESGLSYIEDIGFKSFRFSEGKVVCGAADVLGSMIFKLDFKTLSCSPLVDGSELVRTKNALYFIRKKDYNFTPGTDAQVIRYNLATGREYTLKLPGVFPNDLALSKKNGMLFIGSGMMTEKPERVYIYSLKTNEIIDSLPGRLYVISPDGDSVFIVGPSSERVVKYKLPELKAKWKVSGNGYTPYIHFVKIKQ